MSTDDPRDDRDRVIIARARARIDERHIEDRQARWWTWTIIVTALLFAGWVFYAYNSEQTTASNPPVETMGRQPNGAASPQTPGQ
jgi:hypothetical protein